MSLFDFIYIVCGVPWLFLMITTSGAYTTQKMVLVFALCITSILEIFIKRKGLIYKKATIAVVCISIYCFFSLLLGITEGYKFKFEEDYSLIYTYIFTPFIILFLSQIFYQNKYRKDFLWKFVIIITLILEGLDLGKMLSNMGMIPSLLVFDFVKIGSDVFTTELSYRISNEAAFMFLLPVFSVMLIKSESKKEKVLYGIIVILGTFYSIMSGRKMLEIVFFGTMAFFSLGEMRRVDLNLKIKNLLIGVVTIVIVFQGMKYLSLGLGYDSIIEKAWDTIVNGLNRSSVGGEIRINCAKSLFDLWLCSPLIGNGLNSYATVLANKVTYWSYEVVYNALLAQIGIVGICLIFYPAYRMLRNIYQNYKVTLDYRYLAIFVGFICFLICGASNPLVYFIWPWAITLSFSFPLTKKTR